MRDVFKDLNRKRAAIVKKRRREYWQRVKRDKMLKRLSARKFKYMRWTHCVEGPLYMKHRRVYDRCGSGIVHRYLTTNKKRRRAEV